MTDIKNRVTIFSDPIYKNHTIAVIKNNELLFTADNFAVIGSLLKIWKCKLRYAEIYIDPLVCDEWIDKIALTGRRKNWLIMQQES